jgi:hypothetical protein
MYCRLKEAGLKKDKLVTYLMSANYQSILLDKWVDESSEYLMVVKFGAQFQ